MPVIWRTITAPVHICADAMAESARTRIGPCQTFGAPESEYDDEAGGAWFWDKNYCSHCGEKMERGLIQPKTKSRPLKSGKLKKVKSGKPRKRTAALDSDVYGFRNYEPGSQRPAPEFGPDAFIDSFGELRMHIHDS